MRSSSYLFRGSLVVLGAFCLGGAACNLITGADGLELEEEWGSSNDQSSGPGGQGGSSTGTAPGGSDGGSSTSSGTTDNGALTDAGGVSMTQIAIYQAVKSTFMVNGGPGDGSVPVVAGRDALVRVWLALDANYNLKPVVARLRIEGVADPIQVTQVLTGAPVENSLASTLNFEVPGASIPPGANFRIELLQPQLDSKGPNPAAYYPGTGYAPTNAVNVGQTLKIVLVPVSYGADGSNRLPDTSANVLQGYKDLFYAMYPAPQIDLTVRDPVQWNTDVSPNGYGWDDLLGYIGQVRQQDGAGFDTYYYGAFSPANSLGAYCGGGCVAGLGNIAQSPGDSYARAAIGLGFGDDGGKTAWETAVHEIGHTHGRYHSPCGGAQGTDPNYPYPGAKIGVWGYNLLTKQLYDPNGNTDVMGYCFPIWVSDFTYDGLLNRIKAVNNANIIVPPEVKNRTYDRASVDGNGQLHWLPALKMEMPPQGDAVDLDVDAAGGSYAVTGHYYPYDHLPGGVYVWPQADGPSSAVTVQWKGTYKTLLAP